MPAEDLPEGAAAVGPADDEEGFPYSVGIISGQVILSLGIEEMAQGVPCLPGQQANQERYDQIHGSFS